MLRLGMQAYRAYENAIDLTLYQAFVELILQTAQYDDEGAAYRKLWNTQIWQVHTAGAAYFAHYQLRYPGEVLERFEEKLGSDIRVLRALALAMGRTREIQTDHMFVGSQRQEFLQKVRRASSGDLYLQGALSLLETDSTRQCAMVDRLVKMEHTRTEDALFVLSLFDDREEGYQAMHSQLIRLFGPGRTISLVYDFGVLEWFIHFYEKQVKAYRGKADLVLRTLLKLPHMNVKPDGREFSILTSAGYSGAEITLGNSLSVWADRIPDRLDAQGMTAERIAANCCQTMLNWPEELPEELYAYAEHLFQYYKKFHVKYEGFENLWEAIRTGLAPTAPQTILWMNRSIKKWFPYRFDVFDSRYDLLAQKLERDCYIELFTEQLLNSQGAVPIHRWMARYRELTGTSYIAYFSWYRRNGSRAFALLVEKKVIDLWKFFEEHKLGGADQQEIKLLRKYAMKVSSWRCFRFVKKLLGQYTFSELQKFFGSGYYFHDGFVESKGYYGSSELQTSIVRPFLTAEQQRELFEWVDASFFQTKPERYDAFVLSALNDPKIRGQHDQPLLSEVLHRLAERGRCKNYELSRLKEIIYSKKELEAEEEAAAAEQERQHRLQRQKRLQELQERMKQQYDGSAESLVRFTGAYYHREERQTALEMVFEMLRVWPAGCAETLPPEEVQNFFKLCGELVRREVRPRAEILDMVQMMIGGKAA